MDIKALTFQTLKEKNLMYWKNTGRGNTEEDDTTAAMLALCYLSDANDYGKYLKHDYTVLTWNGAGWLDNDGNPLIIDSKGVMF